MTDEDPENLNLRAYLALQGASLDWRDDLARLMRSDVPLSRMLRDRLADAFENEAQTGIRLELKNHKSARDQFAKIAILHERMKIGHWISERRAEGGTAKAVNAAAAEHFRVSEKTVEPAFAYFKKATVWIDAAVQSEPGRVMGRNMIEALYHSMTARPEMKRVNAELIKQMGLSH